MKLKTCLLLAACGRPLATSPDASSPDGSPDAVVVDDRPTLVVELSVYGHHWQWLRDAWGAKTVDPRRATFLGVDGTPDSLGQLSFNAGRSCCDDLWPDSESAILDAVCARLAQGDVRPRAALWGQSNGAFMALRLICDHADAFASAVAFSGAAPSPDDPPCSPSEPVSIVEAHGTVDDVIFYDRGARLHRMLSDFVPDPGGTQRQLSDALDCDAPTTQVGAMDVASSIDGPETDVLTYACRRGSLEHWRVNGAGHLPAVTPAFTAAAVDWVTR